LVEVLGKDRVFAASNPCRLRYCTQDILIIREEIMSKMRRHSVLAPNPSHSLSDHSSSSSSCSSHLASQSQSVADGGEENEEEKEMVMAHHLATTILSQAHLSPLEINVRPVYWNFDHALHLLPLPDLLIVADRQSQFAVSQSDCIVANPGCFTTDFRFMVYSPSSRTATPSKVPSPEELEDDDSDENGDEEEEEEEQMQTTQPLCDDEEVDESDEEDEDEEDEEDEDEEKTMEDGVEDDE